jgi:hypothetical protein
VCERWFLHKFRANFATELLQGRNGDPAFNIEDVLYLMGHKDLESIQRYVAYVKGKALTKGAYRGPIFRRAGAVNVGGESGINTESMNERAALANP